MLEKNNNLVATAISETFNNSDNNYLLGDWCRKVSDFSKNQYSIKFIHEHHWSDKMKMDDDRDYDNNTTTKTTISTSSSKRWKPLGNARMQCFIFV